MTSASPSRAGEPEGARAGWGARGAGGRAGFAGAAAEAGDLWGLRGQTPAWAWEGRRGMGKREGSREGEGPSAKAAFRGRRWWGARRGRGAGGERAGAARRGRR
jgi:hypothetical protein